jgi:PAS domain S-box-containing protein
VETLIENVEDERTRDRRGRALFEAIDDAVFVHDLDGRILDANPAACRRLGYTREEILGLTTRQIDAPDFAGDFQERLKQQLALGRLTCEGRHRTKDGRIIPVDINTSTVEIDGQPAILAVIRDIGARKIAERRRAADYAVTHVLAESPTLEDAAPKILEAIGVSVGWEMGVVWEVDARTNLLRCVAVWHDPLVKAPEFENQSRKMTFASGE